MPLKIDGIYEAWTRKRDMGAILYGRGGMSNFGKKKKTRYRYNVDIGEIIYKYSYVSKYIRNI